MAKLSVCLLRVLHYRKQAKASVQSRASHIDETELLFPPALCPVTPSLQAALFSRSSSEVLADLLMFEPLKVTESLYIWANPELTPVYASAGEGVLSQCPSEESLRHWTLHQNCLDSLQLGP